MKSARRWPCFSNRGARTESPPQLAGQESSAATSRTRRRWPSAARKLSKNPALPGIYMTINPCDPACLARCPEAYKPYAETTTNDSEIARRCWLPIDCDAKRVADVSSTDEEKAAAGAVASRIHDYLHEEGFPGLVLADSGNGWHILIPIDLPNDAGSAALCSRFLSALAEKFDTDKARRGQKTL